MSDEVTEIAWCRSRGSVENLRRGRDNNTRDVVSSRNPEERGSLGDRTNGGRGVDRCSSSERCQSYHGG